MKANTMSDFNIYTIQPTTKRELKSNVFQQYFKSLKEVRVLVYAESSDINGNRTAKIEVTGSFEDHKGNMYCIVYNPRNRFQTGSDRLNGALRVMEDMGFHGLGSQIKNKALQHQGATDSLGRSVLFVNKVI